MHEGVHRLSGRPRPLAQEGVVELDAEPQSRTGQPAPAQVPGGRERTVVVNGFTKSHTLTGWRTSFMAGPEAVIAAAGRIQSQVLGNHLRDFLDQDISLFLIDHDMGLVLNVCDYIYVLDFGQIISHGTPAEVRTDPAVIAAYLGESAGEAQAQDGATFGSTLTEEA